METANLDKAKLEGANEEVMMGGRKKERFLNLLRDFRKPYKKRRGKERDSCKPKYQPPRKRRKGR